VPTSVLLAVLAAASLLALAPALVRRYDAAERLVAERALSTARVLNRRRRRRSVPGRTPVNPPRVLVVTLRPASPDSEARRARPHRSVRRRPQAPARRRRRGAPPVYRRRRVLAALLLLNAVELAGVVIVGPGFWVGVAVTMTLLVTFLGYLRTIALADRRRRRIEARRAAWLAARQAEVRRAQERRAAERKAAQKRLAAQREAVRRAIAGLDRPGAVRGQPYSIRYGEARPGDSRVAGL
jgi:hypothetical protein